jgi:hypothetical protein
LPASWLIEDDDLRSTVVRVIARRFAALTVLALVGLLATGLTGLCGLNRAARSRTT